MRSLVLCLLKERNQKPLEAIKESTIAKPAAIEKLIFEKSSLEKAVFNESSVKETPVKENSSVEKFSIKTTTHVILHLLYMSWYIIRTSKWKRAGLSTF